MGVDYEHLVVYGYTLPYSTLEYQTAEPYLYDTRTEGDPVVVYDGRAGEYILIGILQHRSENGRHNRATLPLLSLDTPPAPQRTALNDLLNELSLSPSADPTHHVLTHMF